MTNPTLSFSLALDLEDCGATLCDGAWVEYSSDGINWNQLGSYGQGTNWYNKSSSQLWSISDYTRWHVATIPLPTAINRLRLRFVLSSDPAANREGIAIDDIHIYDNTKGIYDGSTMAAPITQTVSGSNWVDFTSGGKLVASLLPNNQGLGATDVQTFINTAPVRYTSSQYYLDRNITIKPANSPSDSVSVRFYFLDSESDSLLAAKGCATCTKPSTAYDLGISKYSDPDRSFENGTIVDNQQGLWNFILPGSVAKVPFDKGYYAEFKVKDFSEFWLNNGGMDKTKPLPVKLLDLIARKLNSNDVLLQWTLAQENGVKQYELELAKGNADLQAGRFVKLAELPSLGDITSTRTYNFSDLEPDKFGPRYYRLKVVNFDGSFTYSPIRSVVFADAVLWQVYPNPSTGVFNLVYQLTNNEQLYTRIVDAKGSLVHEYSKSGNGFPQKLNIDLSTKPKGVYLLQVQSPGKTQSFKLYKL